MHNPKLRLYLNRAHDNPYFFTYGVRKTIFHIFSFHSSNRLLVKDLIWEAQPKSVRGNWPLWPPGASRGLQGAATVGHMRVVWAEDLQLDIERLLVHGQGLLWLTLLVEHVSDAA